MNIGIFGAGTMAQAFAALARRAGHKVMMCNSGPPDRILNLAGQLDAYAGTVNETAEFADIAFAALPLQASTVLPTTALAGKIVLNPHNYFPHFGYRPEIESGGTAPADILANHLPKSHIVKAFNAILAEDVMPHARPAGAPDRRALPLAWDNPDAKETAIGLIDQLGFDIVDAGALSEGWRFDRRRPVYCRALNKSSLTEMLNATQQDHFMEEGHWRHYDQQVNAAA